jgi:hypothetical protein
MANTNNGIRPLDTEHVRTADGSGRARRKVARVVAARAQGFAHERDCHGEPGSPAVVENTRRLIAAWRSCLLTRSDRAEPAIGSADRPSE